MCLRLNVKLGLPLSHLFGEVKLIYYAIETICVQLTLKNDSYYFLLAICQCDLF